MRFLPVLVLAACTGTSGSVIGTPDAASDAIAPPDPDGPSGRPWMQVAGPNHLDLRSVTARAANDIVAVGVELGDSQWEGGITRFDGTSWTETGYLHELYAVHGRYAAGTYGGEGSITFQMQTGEWRSREVIAATNFRGTWTGTGAFIVGDNGHLWATTEPGVQGSWVHLGIGLTSSHLLGVWGPTPTHVFAVGTAGTILVNPDAGFGAGGVWSKSTHGSSNLRAIWGSSADDLYIVGEAPAVILHSTNGGASWTAQTLPSDVGGLYAITGTSATDVYAVGATEAAGAAVPNGLVLHSTGNGVWTIDPTPVTPPLRGVAAAPTGELYAVGDNGTILRRVP